MSSLIIGLYSFYLQFHSSPVLRKQFLPFQFTTLSLQKIFAYEKICYVYGDYEFEHDIVYCRIIAKGKPSN